MSLSWGCSSEQAPIAQQRQSVRAIWDPNTATLPTPTDLVRDPTTGRLNLPIDPAQTAAEREFRAYLNSLDGYPITSTLTIPVSGPVDEGTLGGAVFLIDDEAGRSLDINARYDAQRDSIIAVPRVELEANRLKPGHTYSTGLWGYQGGAQGMQGLPVVADAAFYLLRTGQPLDQHLGALPGATLDEKRDAADRLDVISADYDSLFNTLERFGPERAQIATAARFTTTSQPSVWMDPATGQVPIPNNLLYSPTDKRVTLPEAEGDDEFTRHIKVLLSEYDGFSTTGSITIRATDAFDAADVADPALVRLFQVLPDGQIKEDTQIKRGILQDTKGFFIEPKLALEPNAQYVYVLMMGIKNAQGQEFKPQPLSALMRSKAPLLDAQGQPTVASIDQAQAELIEPVRAQTAPVLDMLKEREGIERAQILTAVPFKTVSSVEFLMDWRAKLYKEQLRTDVVNTLEASPSDRGLLLLMPSVRTIVTGEMTVMDHLDYETLAMREDGTWEPRLAKLTLTIPRSAQKGQPVKTVVFGHGLLTSRELLYMIAEALAQKGWASISVDLPLHGERSVCLEDGNCQDNGRCGDQGQCVLPDGSRGDLKRISSPWPNGPTYPVTSGVPFIDIAHIDGARDHFIQAVLDLCQLVRVTRSADWAAISGGYVLDADDMVYLGMSLGGILGSILTVVEPTLTDFVLNVPGAGYLDMVQASAAFRSLFDEELQKRGILEGSDDFRRFLTAARWLVDPVDPVNVVQHTIFDPISYIDPVDGQQKQAPVKRVLMQMAEGDSVVPNISTRILSERMKVPYTTYTPAISNHGFLFDPTSFEGRRARQDMLEFFDQR